MWKKVEEPILAKFNFKVICFSATSPDQIIHFHVYMTNKLRHIFNLYEHQTQQQNLL